MKNLFLIFLFATALLGQDKGRISLTFNDEKMDLPIRSIMINKQENINIRVQAEINNDSLQQMIGLELEFKKLSPDDKNEHNFDCNGISINNISKPSTGSTLQINFRSSKETATYSFSKGLERVMYEINSLSMRMEIEKIEFKEAKLFIIGNMSGMFRSVSEKGKPRKEVAEIKDCKFEIIL